MHNQSLKAILVVLIKDSNRFIPMCQRFIKIIVVNHYVPLSPPPFQIADNIELLYFCHACNKKNAKSYPLAVFGNFGTVH
jgi:hypothetical protein